MSLRLIAAGPPESPSIGPAPRRCSGLVERLFKIRGRTASSVVQVDSEACVDAGQKKERSQSRMEPSYVDMAWYQSPDLRSQSFGAPCWVTI